MLSETEILNLVKSQPGLKGREIAVRLKTEKSEVNSMLWKLQSRGLTRQDNAYRWFVVQKTTGSQAQSLQTTKELTRLGRLCRYYLECLSLDDEAGVRVFARSQYGLDYVELPEIAGVISDRTITEFPGVDDLFRRLRNERERKVPYIGYPVRLKRHKSNKGWEGFFLEPVFLFAFTDEALRSRQIVTLSDETPSINSAVIKSLAIGNEAFVMEETAKLAEELGLGEPDGPDFDEVVERLTQIREEWDWKETIDPSRLSSGDPLSKIEAEGIYNRCIIFGCERSPFTKGLEQELASDPQKNRISSFVISMLRYGLALATRLVPSALKSFLAHSPLQRRESESLTRFF